MDYSGIERPKRLSSAARGVLSSLIPLFGAHREQVRIG